MKKPKNYSGFAWNKHLKKKKRKKYQKFYKKHGFDPTETWNLDITIADFVIPRLKYFRQNLNGHPGDITFKQWKKYLDQMIEGFENATYEDIDMNDGEPVKDTDKMKKGLDLFSSYYNHLWD